MLYVCVGKRDRQEAVLHRVVVKDIGEAWTDHRAKGVVAERTDRVLARTAASKVRARDQDRGALEARLVQLEVLVLGAIGIQAPIAKETLLETGSHHRLQKLFWNELTGTDIAPTERRDHAGEIL